MTMDKLTDVLPRFVVKRAVAMVGGETYLNVGGVDQMVKYRHGAPDDPCSWEYLVARQERLANSNSKWQWDPSWAGHDAAAVVDLHDDWHRANRYRWYDAAYMNMAKMADRKCYRFTTACSNSWVIYACGDVNRGDTGMDWLTPDRYKPWSVPHTAKRRLAWAIVDTWDGWDWISTSDTALPAPVRYMRKRGEDMIDDETWVCWVTDRSAPHSQDPGDYSCYAVKRWDELAKGRFGTALITIDTHDDWHRERGVHKVLPPTAAAPLAPAPDWAPAVGDRVRRGPKWRWGDQDVVAGVQVVGTIIDPAPLSFGWWIVQWDGGAAKDYDVVSLQLVTPGPKTPAPAPPTWQWTPEQRNQAIVKAYEAKIQAVDSNIWTRLPWHCANCGAKDEWPAAFRACPLCAQAGPAKHFATSGVYIHVPIGPKEDDLQEEWVSEKDTRAAWSRVLRARTATPVDADALVAGTGAVVPRVPQLACDGTLPCDLIGHDVMGPPRGAVE